MECSPSPSCPHHDHDLDALDLCVCKLYQSLQSSEDGVTTGVWLKHVPIIE